MARLRKLAGLVATALLVIALAGPVVLLAHDIECRKSHFLTVMQNLSRNETKSRLRDLFNGSTLDYTELLTWENERLNFTWDANITRHEDPFEILSYGKGRCGEFAILYVGLCLAHNYQAKLVVNMLGDHMWTEIKLEDHWIHVDPSAKRINDPHMYERDWGACLILVYAFSNETVEDVTWNYKMVDFNGIRDLVVTIGSLLGVLGGIPQILRILKRKPRLSIEGIEIKTYAASETAYGSEPAHLVIDFNIWNGRGLIRRMRASDASFIRTEITAIDERSRAIGQQIGPAFGQTIPVGTHFHYSDSFQHSEDFERFSIKVKCDEESVVRRNIKIKDYVKAT